MSFVKIPRKYPTRVHSVKKKKKPPEWDARRKAVALSSNMDLVKADKMQKKISKARGDSMANRKRKTALLKEVLYDTSQLHDVLAKSDKMMSVVRDLFGDDPVKYRGLPHVTTAPDSSLQDSTNLPDGSILEGPSRLDMLSDSIMDKSALNDFQDETESVESADTESSYQPALDYDRFQRLLSQADKEIEREKNTGGKGGRLTHSMADRILEQLASKLCDEDKPVEAPCTPNAASPATGAINDTLKVQKTKSRLTDEEKAISTQPNEDPSSLDNLRMVLDGLEQNIGAFEQMTGREPSIRQPVEDSSLTGFTGRLVTAVNKVSRYLKENELRLRAETTLREQLHQDLMYTKTLVDTLTGDIIATQEQYITLQSEFARYRKETMEQIQGIKQGLESRGIQIHPIVLPTPQIAAAAPTVAQRQTQQPQQQMYNTLVQTEIPIQRPEPALAQRHEQLSVMQTQPMAQPMQQFDERQAQITSDANNLSQQFADRVRVAQSEGTTAVPLTTPRQSDSPKVQGRHTSRVGPEERQLRQSNPATMPHTSQENIMYQSHNVAHQNGIGMPNSDHVQPQNRQVAFNNVSNSVAYVDDDGNMNQLKPVQSVSISQHQRGQSVFQPAPNPSAHTQNLMPVQRITNQNRQQVLQKQQHQNQAGVTSLDMQKAALQQMHPSVIKHPRNTNQPLQGQQMVMPSHLTSGGQRMPMNVQGPMSPQNLERQIEELNRQHSEAQSKLQMLMERQHVVEDKLLTKNMSVSPPISPITVGSDNEIQQPNGHHMEISEAHMKPPKAIKIALPRVENIIDLQNQEQ